MWPIEFRTMTVVSYTEKHFTMLKQVKHIMETKESRTKSFESCLKNECQRIEHLPLLDLIEVNAQIKGKLLGNAMKGEQDARERSGAVLRRMAELNHDLALQFGRKEEIQDRFPLRLLRESICPSATVERRDTESFIAVSYCWHMPDWNLTEGLSQPEAGWPISPQMATAVLNERTFPSEGIWIDQRCINQNDKEEKKNLIGSIDLIFKSARLVIAVLEDVSLTYAEENMLQKWLPQVVKGIAIEPRKDREIVSRAFYRILSARWFKRAWCSDELQIAGELSLAFLVGNHIRKIDRESFDAMTMVLQAFGAPPLDVLNCGQHIEFINKYKNFRRPPHINCKWWDVEKSLTSQFRWIHELDCSVPTDKITICLNIAGLDIYFKGVNKPASECRWITAVITLAAGDGAVLDDIRDFSLHSSQENAIGVSDANHDWMSAAPYTGMPRLVSSAIHSVDHTGICLDILDLTACSVVRPANAQVSIASIFVEAISVKCGFAQERKKVLMPREGINIDVRRKQSLASEIIGCVLSCGLEWILLQISSIRMPWQDMMENLLRYSENERVFYDEVKKMLIAAKIVDGQKWKEIPGSLIKKLNYFFGYLIYVNPFNGSSIPRLSTDYLYRACHNLKLKECAIVEVGSKSKALVLLSSHPRENEILAVPHALQGSSCVSLRRLWCLKKNGDAGSGSWTVTSMSHLLSFIPFEVVESLVIERKCQKVSRERDLRSNLVSILDLLDLAAPLSGDEVPLLPVSTHVVMANFLKLIRPALLRSAKEPGGGKKLLIGVWRRVRHIQKHQRMPYVRDSHCTREHTEQFIRGILSLTSSIIQEIHLDSSTYRSAYLEFIYLEHTRPT